MFQKISGVGGRLPLQATDWQQHANSTASAPNGTEFPPYGETEQRNHFDAKQFTNATLAHLAFSNFVEFSAWHAACLEVAALTVVLRRLAAPTVKTRRSRRNSVFCHLRSGLMEVRTDYESARRNVMRNVFLGLVVLGVLGATQSASAQIFVAETHCDSVPHTTTHFDYVPHGNHVDAVPHTTTHRHLVPHTTYRRVYPRRVLVPHATTHIEYVRHGNHVDMVPHTTTHFHSVPLFRRGFGGGHYGHFFHR